MVAENPNFYKFFGSKNYKFPYAVELLPSCRFSDFNKVYACRPRALRNIHKTSDSAKNRAVLLHSHDIFYFIQGNCFNRVFSPIGKNQVNSFNHTFFTFFYGFTLGIRAGKFSTIAYRIFYAFPNYCSKFTGHYFFSQIEIDNNTNKKSYRTYQRYIFINFRANFHIGGNTS